MAKEARGLKPATTYLIRNTNRIGAVPPELDAGAGILLKVKVSCPAGCDMRGISVKVVAADEVLITSELVTYGEAINETGDLALKAPE